MQFEVVYTRRPELKSPVLVEGLPGIGHVGKIAATHMIRELRAKKFARLYSASFPPHVVIRRSGIIEEMKNEFYYWQGDKKDIIFVVGNTQSTSPEGQYLLCEKILDIASQLGAREMYTLGGLGVGRPVDSPRVFGAVNHPRYIPLLEERGVVVKRDGAGQIIGVSGMLLSQGKRRRIYGACLMGETSGFYVDPNSARAVLEVLTSLLGVEVSMERLRKRVRDAARRVEEAAKLERKMMEDMGIIRREPTDDEMRYIG
ncbi:proteasome assembly chaperone family protein [Candidatus Pyrohabitans sp.]